MRNDLAEAAARAAYEHDADGKPVTRDPHWYNLRDEDRAARTASALPAALAAARVALETYYRLRKTLPWVDEDTRDVLAFCEFTGVRYEAEAPRNGEPGHVWIEDTKTFPVEIMMTKLRGFKSIMAGGRMRMYSAANHVFPELRASDD